MGFYIRKSFRLGPVRLNLSRSGIGVSAGVTGARIGVNARGRPYVHAGRGGIYYRRFLDRPGGKSREEGAHAGDASARDLDVRQDTEATFPAGPEAAPAGADPRRATTLRERFVPRQARVAPGLVLAGLGALALAAPWRPAAAGGTGPALWFLAGAGLILIGSGLAVRSWRRKRAAARLEGALEAALAPRTPLDADAAEALRRALQGASLPPREVECRSGEAYLRLVEAVVRDRRVGAVEVELLEQAENLLPAPPGFFAAARVESFRTATLEAVADHDLTAEEESSLDHLRAALAVPEDAAATEQAVIRRLREVREIRSGRIPEVEAGRPLRRGEQCRFAGKARILRERTLRSFEREGARGRVRGLVVHREGTLLVTDRRLLFSDGSDFSVPLNRIVDVDVDADRNLIAVARQGVRSPLLLTAPDALRAGAVLAAAAGL